MGKREGIVVSVEGKYANLLTPYGEFIKVNCNGKKPNVGQEFEGEEVSHKLIKFNTRKLIAVACIMFALLIGGGAKAYYSPIATVLVNINPSIELKVNFLNKIISFRGLNNDGNKIFNEVKINNDNINDALKIIIEQAKKDKFIDKNYTKTITIDIHGKNIDISKFKSNMVSSNLSVKIELNGDIILNNKPKNRSNKNLNSSDKAATKVSTPSSEEHLSDKKEDKTLNNSSSENKSSSGGNSSSYKEKDKGESNVKQSQNTDNNSVSNKVKENQNSNKKTEGNNNSKYNNNSNKDNNSHQQNSNGNNKK